MNPQSDDPGFSGGKKDIFTSVCCFVIFSRLENMSEPSRLTSDQSNVRLLIETNESKEPNKITLH